MEATTPLLTPYKMGKFNLAHRSYENMAQPHNALYYEQRAAPGVLLIAEACAASETARVGFPPVPGLWSNEQVDAWKPVVDAVHAKGALFFCQIWHTGRGMPPTESGAPPRLEAKDIPQMVNDFRIAARNAIKAGFDGVEIHAANGFLVNQFWWFIDTDPLRQEDQRFIKDAADEAISDDGSSLVDTRCRRFTADVVAAVADEIGAHLIGVRLSPFAACTDDADPEGHALHLVQSMDKLGVLYCHMVEPRTTRADDGGASEDDGKLAIWRRLLPFREAFRGTLMVNGGYGRDEGDKVVGGGYADLVSYGRLFLANPDLPERFRKKAGLNKYDRSTFYTSHPVLGYTDYPFLGQQTPA